MSWNYRVIKHRAPNGETYYGLHEVYYGRKRGEIDGWVPTPEVMAESLDDLLGMINLMRQAVTMASNQTSRVLDEAEMPGGK